MWGGKTVEQVLQKGGRCHIPWNIQDQIGWGSEQLGLFDDVLIHLRGGGQNDL